MRQSRERTRVWRAPIALGILSAIGLIAALLSDQLGDWIAWITLGIPVAVILWYMTPRNALVRERAEADAVGAEE